MRIAIISDLHLSPKGNLDIFQHNENTFVDFLKDLENSHDKIILLGDIVETLMPETYADSKTSFSNIWNERYKITNRFDSKQYTYILGNHDLIASNIDKIIIEYNNKKVIFIHGHQFDMSTKYANPLVWIGGYMLRKGYSQYNTLAQTENIRYWRAPKFEKSAVQFAKKYNADIIITGHSHVQKKKMIDNVMFLNTGFCAYKNINYISMDLKNENYFLGTRNYY